MDCIRERVGEGARLAAAAGCYGDQRKVCGWLSVLKASHQFVVIIVMGDFAIVVQANQLTATIHVRSPPQETV